MDNLRIELNEYINNYLELPLKNDNDHILQEKEKEDYPRRGFIAKMLSDFDAEYYEELDEEIPKRRVANIDSYINENHDKENRFQKLLFKYIDRSGLSDSEVYTAGGIDRRLFSKIRSDENYHPSKDTVIQLAIGLKLNLDELLSLLESSSYYLPKNNFFDLIIRFSFEKKIYDLMKINEFLYEYDCKLLGRD